MTEKLLLLKLSTKLKHPILKTILNARGEGTMEQRILRALEDILQELRITNDWLDSINGYISDDDTDPDPAKSRPVESFEEKEAA